MANFDFLRVTPVNILRYLPKFLYENEKDFANIANVLSDEHEKQRQAAKDLMKQFFLQTATWGLDEWEVFVGETTDHDLSDDVRRRRIKTHLDLPPSVTVQFLKDLVDSYLPQKNTQIIEHNEKYWFEVIISGNQEIDWEGIAYAINLYKPAHLGFGYVKQTTIQQNYYIGGMVGTFKEYTITPKLLKSINAENISYIGCKPSQFKDINIEVASILGDIHSDLNKNIGIANNVFKEYSVRPKNITNINGTQTRNIGVSFSNYKEIVVSPRKEDEQ